MRSALTLSLFASVVSLSAQLHNGGFEDLGSLDMPAYWGAGSESTTIGDLIVVDSAKYLLNTTDVHSGQHAVELRNAYNYTQNLGLPGLWMASSLEDGYGGFSAPDVPIAQRPTALRFWAKYAPVQGDSAYAEIKVFGEFQQEIGSGSLRIGGNVGSYTALEVPVVYGSADEAFYINVRFITIVPGGNAHLGTRLLLDDVDVQYSGTGIAEMSGNALGISPNPATDQVRIELPGTGSPATVKVFSSTGRLERVADVRNGILSVADLPTGAYFLQTEQNGQRAQAPLLIAR